MLISGCREGVDFCGTQSGGRRAGRAALGAGAVRPPVNLQPSTLHPKP